MQTDLFTIFLDEIKSKLTLPPDQPDETAESTLRALWLAAEGKPCSATRAMKEELSKLDSGQEATLRALVLRRINGTPLMHLTGRTQFMGIELLFDPGVCLVRPETEILGEATVSFLRERGKTSDQLRMIDVGCGSGNLTCGVAASVKSLHVWSVDISSKCIALTSKNVIQCGLTDRVKVAQGDLFEPLESNELYGQIDAIVCNPPYIASNRLKGDRSFLLIHEPHEALDGGPFGFKVQLRLIKDSVRFLRPGCCLLFEFGEGQHNQVRSLIQRTNAYETVNFSFDKLGNPRVAIAQKKA